MLVSGAGRELRDLSPLALEGEVNDAFRLCTELLTCSGPRPVGRDAKTLQPAWQLHGCCPLPEAAESLPIRRQ